MAYTNIKTEIDGKIYTNILREITGDILNEVLKKMVDSLGKGYRYMGILEPDGSRPSGDENMFMIATEAGYYTALANDIPSGITICSFSEGSIQVETILNLNEIFSGNHNWGGDNTFSAELKVAFESLVDLNSDENLQDMLNALMPRVLTAVENHIATFDAYGRAKDSGVSVDDLAKKDGISEKLVSGSSRGILSPSAIEELFLFQRTANGAGGTGAAIFQSIKGNSIVWNQYVNAETSTFNECTITKNANGTYTVSGAGTVARYKTMSPNQFGAIGHKLLYKFHIISGSGVAVYDAGNLTPSGGYVSADKEMIYTQEALSTWTLIRAANATDDCTFSLVIFDLTQMFGQGKEPASVAAFNALYPLISSAYNPGAILNNCATGMVTDGLNQWDEIWESGYIDSNTGQPVAASNAFRSKNYIRVIPDSDYYFRIGAATISQALTLRFYDVNKNYLGYADKNGNSNGANEIRTIPSNAHYIKFAITAAYYRNNNTYLGDICINLSWSGYRNGEYEPHWSDTTPLPITTATGKLNGEGESVVITPNGLAGVGTSFDEAIVEKGVWTKTAVRRARVDLGTLTWGKNNQYGYYAPVPGMAAGVDTVKGNIISPKYIAATWNAFYVAGKGSGLMAISSQAIGISSNAADVDAFLTEVSGVILEYELATEQLYVLDTPVPVVARVDENGTQTITPQGVDESGAPMTAPFKASIQYPVKLGVAPIGQQSLVNLLERMKSAGKIASYTMVWDATTGVYDFTIS